MTLRMRLLAVYALVGLSLMVGSVSVLHLQRNYLDSKIDGRLVRLSSVAEQIVRGPGAPDAQSSELLRGFWEGYIGVFEQSGELKVVSTPSADQQLSPDVDLYSASVEPQTVATRFGNADFIRTMTVGLSDGRIALVGLTTTDRDSALTRLRNTLVLVNIFILSLLGLALWWLVRLGFRPIVQLTREAEAIARGDQDGNLEFGLPSSSETAMLRDSISRAIAVKEDSERRMRQFIADASHELRTPLTSVDGYSSLYLSGALKTQVEVDDAMHRINSEAKRMSNLVTDLTTLSDLELRPRFMTESFSLFPVLQNLVSDFRITNQGRTIELNCSTDIMIFSDSEVVFQVISILVSNAIRHTPSETSIWVVAEKDAGGVKINVTDEGPGIDAQHLTYLFDRFYRVDPSRSTATGGSGLGLSILGEIMKSAGGDYGVESVVGSGSSFWIRFPSMPVTADKSWGNE